MWSDEPAESGRLSAGDMGGVCVVRESCCRIFNDATSLAKDVEDPKLSVLMMASFTNELEAVSKLSV